MILSHSFWNKYFNADENVIGKVLNLDDAAYTIVGVMPPDLHSLYGGNESFWVPMVLKVDKGYGYTSNVYARLKDDVTFEEAQTHMALVAITGSFSSGKSTVLKFLKARGAKVFDADKRLHTCYLDKK